MSTVSEQVLQVSLNYLGPAARKFLERQTTSHMEGLRFDDISSEHLPQLSWWIHASSKLVIDSARAKEFSDRVAAIGKISGSHAQ
jgi:hypothetical protein